MDISNLKRDSEYIKKYIKKLDDNSIIFLKQALVMIPKKWEDKDLISVKDTTTMVGVFCIIIDDKYAVSLVSSLIETDPSAASSETIESEEYYIFSYNVNDRLMVNSKLVKRDNLPYKLFTFIFDKGKIPWYMSYVDFSQIYDLSKEYANVNFNLPHSVFEMVTGVIARDKDAKNIFYRHSDWNKKPAYIPLRSVQFVASNTTAKLIGAYWSEGLASALVYPSERKELIEEILRS